MQSYILMVRFSECQNYQNINESDGNVKYSRTYGLKCDDNKLLALASSDSKE